MNRINQLFDSNPRDLLSIYFCAGYPTLEGTTEVIRTLEKHGVNMIEIGIPFSDPMADGMVIQNAATQALRNGMSLRLLFEQLHDIRRDVKIPLILMDISTRSCSSALTTSAGNAPNAALTESSFPTFLSKTIRNTSAPLQSGMT